MWQTDRFRYFAECGRLTDSGTLLSVADWQIQVLYWVCRSDRLADSVTLFREGKWVQMARSVSVSVSVSAQDGTIALGKALMCSAPSLSSLPKVALETVSLFVWLNTDRCQPWKVECWPLPFSTPLSFRRSVMWCSGLSMFRRFLKPLSTSALPICRPDVLPVVLASLFWPFIAKW